MKRGKNRGGDLGALVAAYIQHQANPHRVGCPTLDELEAFLYGQLKQSGWFYDHLSHCRECLLELKTLRNIMWGEIQKGKSRTQAAAVA